MSIVMYKAKFICLKNKDHIKYEYVWSNEDKEIHCDQCKSLMNEEETPPQESNFNIGGKNPQRGFKEGRKRSIEHFKKEIYPTLPESEKKFFRKKHNIKDGKK